MAKGIKLGENLKYLRKSKKLTRNQFANQFNAHISEVTRWENDTTPLDDKTIEKIALFYGITKDELISGSFKENNVPTNEIVKEDINEENIIDNYDNRFKKIFLFEKVLCIITLFLEIIIFFLLPILGYTINKFVAISLIIYGSQMIVYYAYRIINEFLYKGKINNNQNKLLELKILNHKFNNHIVALFALNMIMTTIFFFEPVIYNNDIISLKWFITFFFIVFITVFSLDVYTYGYFYEDNNLDYPKGYITLFKVIKNSFNMKTLFFISAILVLVSNFITPIFRTSRINYRLYDFIKDYGNGLYYFSLVLIIFSILLCILVIIKRRIILVPYMILLLGLMFNTISLKLSYNKLSRDGTVFYYTSGYHLLLIMLVVLIVLTIIEIYFDLFTLKKRNLEKRK